MQCYEKTKLKSSQFGNVSNDHKKVYENQINQNYNKLEKI